MQVKMIPTDKVRTREIKRSTGHIDIVTERLWLKKKFHNGKELVKEQEEAWRSMEVASNVPNYNRVMPRYNSTYVDPIERIFNKEFK